MIALLVLCSVTIAYTHSHRVTSDGCFEQFPDQTIECAEHFSRRTGITEEDCLKLCLAQLPQCKSLVFQKAQGRCDLFQVAPETDEDGQVVENRINYRTMQYGYGYREMPKPLPAQIKPALKDEFGTNFYKATGDCKTTTTTTTTAAPTTTTTSTSTSTSTTPEQTTTTTPEESTSTSTTPEQTTTTTTPEESTTTSTPDTTTTTEESTTSSTTESSTTSSTEQTTTVSLPDEVLCDDEQDVRFVEMQGVELLGHDDFTIGDVSVEECYGRCANNELPDGTVAPCRSVDYKEATSSCSLSLDVIPPGADVFRSEGNTYYEKVCVDAETFQDCPGPILRIPNMLYVGVAREVTDAATLAECLEDCVRAPDLFQFQCMSGTFFFNDATRGMACILADDTGTNNPDVFVPEDNNSIYFEPRCDFKKASI